MPFEGPSSYFLVLSRKRNCWFLLTLCTLVFSSVAASAQCSGCCATGDSCSDPDHFACVQCNCHLISPIIVDTRGDGFHLTSALDGVVFDMAGDGNPLQMAWTAAGSGTALLALDRNHNGTIDNGKELFGNFTAQPSSPHPNGFLALAEFDKPENGGNGDGIIDDRDDVFTHLLLWIDENHDGVSQSNELHTLPELGVYSVALRYRDDRSAFDQFGNWFHYVSVLNPDRKDGESKDGRLVFDVDFVIARNPTHGNQSSRKTVSPTLPPG